MEEEKKNRKIDLSMPGRDRHWFVKRIAEKSNFFQKDVDELLDVIGDVISEVVGNKDVLKISGLFTVYLTEKSASKYYDPKEGKLLDTPESYYVSFKASKKLLKYLPEANQADDSKVKEEKL